jgi:hypothetical protein
MQTICDLPWYDDPAAARAEARRTGRPILSLWLLGRLDEELSCANSRFFRRTLYPAASVAWVLRERFVLCWRSLRPVPRVTIDFGDGRRLERTLTGNSVHLVLDPAGRPVDALPGLYDAASFVRLCAAAADLAQVTAPLAGQARQGQLARWHEARRQAALRAWAADLKRLGRKVKPDAAALDAATDDATWTRIGALHAGGALPDPAVRAALAPPDAREAGRLAVTKMAVEGPLLDRLLPLAHTIAEDTARNEYALHTRLHAAVARAPFDDEDVFATWIYTELFRMPPSDPWLGMASAFAAVGEPAGIQRDS